uniref:Reverse transcriptase domain-containing protein n=1 Tax=Tanacetum cinerariifolium TaxID=118510 RepID=A0A699VFF9_TANCI|nr:reverse transcriptase domain-containing protein [Tanacetum cinerariifolium]
MTANKIDVTDKACEEYFQEVLGFFNVTASGSPTPSDDQIVSTTSPTLTPFGDSDFLLFEEANAFLGLEDDPDSPELVKLKRSNLPLTNLLRSNSKTTLPILNMLFWKATTSCLSSLLKSWERKKKSL